MVTAIRPFTSRADMHVHSRYSDRPSEWVLRRMGAPECFVEPEEVYRQAMAAGMDFVTISDHNKIDGALEIASYPNTFISSEITAYFPENDAKMHILVWGISEAEFAVIMELRQDIYALREYMQANDILHSVAHPLFLVNDRLTIDQFESILVMFNRFELINGTRAPRASMILGSVLEQLDSDVIARLADRQGIVPFGDSPHVKILSGGSDDHSGRYVASAHTVTPEAATVDAFLNHLRVGRMKPAGTSGSSIHLAHCFYHIAYDFYKKRLLSGDKGGSVLGEMFKRMLEPRGRQVTSRGARFRTALRDWMVRRRARRLSETEELIVDEFIQLFGNRQTEHSGRPGEEQSAEDAFVASCRLTHHLGYAFSQRFIDKLRTGDLVKSLEAVAAVGPVMAAITPYLAAFKTQHKDEVFMQAVARRFEVSDHTFRGPGRAWLTDTFDDVNGVAHTIKTLGSLGRQNGYPLTVLTCLEAMPNAGVEVHNFKPVGMFELPEYPQQKVAFPPFLQILEYIERERYHELILSTPGPMGLVGLAAAKLLQLRTVAIYHTDFPNYVRTLTDDETLEAIAWRYMHWFYGQCDRILAPSEYYRQHLIDHGFDGKRISVLRRGVDDVFSPERRDPAFWRRFGGNAAKTTFLYVGRISEEKNLDQLLSAFAQLRNNNPDVQLAVVGDGPLRQALQERGGQDVLFTGCLRGERLASAYASADVFVFPSLSDTFGNVVLEAHASGLPAIVSSRGGPQEIVQMTNSGLVVDLTGNGTGTKRLADAMATLAVDNDQRKQCASRALETASKMTWDAILDDLLNDGKQNATSGTVAGVNADECVPV